MTGVNFIGVMGAVPVLVGSESVTPPFVLAESSAHAQGGVQLDRIYFDLGVTSAPAGLGSWLPTVGNVVGGYAKNGCVLLVLEGSTAVDVDFTALGSFEGLTSGAGDTALELVNCLILNNLGSEDIEVSPGDTDGAQVPLDCTVAAGGAVCVWDPAGKAIDANHKILTVTPSNGGVLAIAFGGA